jgi:hypothetical protein
LALYRLTGLKLYDFKCVCFDESDYLDFSGFANSLYLTNINANANLQKKSIGFHIMSNTIEISHLSREEKLKVMEAIWEDLSIEEEQVKSPDWHDKALQETARRLKAGQESIVDWQAGKKELRKRFE